jgi:hypothetical protein
MLDIRMDLRLGFSAEALAAAVQRGHESAVVEIAEYLRVKAVECIQAGVDPWGEPWEPFDPDTRSPTGKLGVRTGAMLASITASPTTPTAGVVRAEVKVGAAYASFFGSRRPILPIVYDRNTNARGRRLKSRSLQADIPEAWMTECAAIDSRHVQAAIDAMSANAQSVQSGGSAAEAMANPWDDAPAPSAGYDAFAD